VSLRRALIVYAIACASFIAVNDAAASYITPVGTSRYKISVPTCEVSHCEGFPSPKFRNYDDIRQHARQYCEKMEMKMVITYAAFDIGPGYTVIFSCIPPKGSEASR
jgi:hypothetical protein